MARFDRIKLVEKNYKKLKGKKVGIVGCGSLGSRTAELLARWGIDFILIDFDKIEKSNLDSQIYFEKDVGKFKAIALKNKLKQINSKAKLEVLKKELTEDNAEKLLSKCDLVVDGTDNLKARFAINKACKKLKIPWVFGSAEKSVGMASCFGKKYEFDKLIKKSVTKKKFGVSPQAAGIVAGFEAEFAIKLLLGKRFEKKLVLIDLNNFSAEGLINPFF